jgi:hypothetical protein
MLRNKLFASSFSVQRGQKIWREMNAATCQLGPEERARIFWRHEVYRLANLSQAALLL